jgi:hypothetical protein
VDNLPTCPAPAGRVEGAGDRVEALEHARLEEEVPAGSEALSVADVEAFDGVGGADDPPDLDAEVEEGHELRPARAPEPGDGRTEGVLALGELL